MLRHKPHVSNLKCINENVKNRVSNVLLGSSTLCGIEKHGKLANFYYDNTIGKYIFEMVKIKPIIINTMTFRWNCGGSEHINLASTASAACRQQSCCSHFADSFEPQMLASDCMGVITGLLI